MRLSDLRWKENEDSISQISKNDLYNPRLDKLERDMKELKNTKKSPSISPKITRDNSRDKAEKTPEKVFIQKKWIKT